MISVPETVDGAPAGTATFLAEVEARLREVLQDEHLFAGAAPTLLENAARHACLAEGPKRVRPRLALLFGRAVEAPRSGLLEVAVAGELLHEGSLLHDDVVDAGEMRRGRSTVNALWGNVAAVLTGDLMFSLAFVELRRSPPEVVADAARTVARMSRAAVREVESRGRLDLNLEAWREIAEGKTGALFAFCGRAAASLGGDREALERFHTCGLHLGVAFQIGDDLLDLLGLDGGKDRFSDVRNRETSYPILLAASQSPGLRRDLERLWASGPPDLETAAEAGMRLLAEGVAEASLRQMLSEMDAAVDALGEYVHRPGGDGIPELAKRICDRIIPGPAF